MPVCDAHTEITKNADRLHQSQLDIYSRLNPLSNDVAKITEKIEALDGKMAGGFDAQEKAMAELSKLVRSIRPKNPALNLVKYAAIFLTSAGGAAGIAEILRVFRK
jgi:hypothetical protein